MFSVLSASLTADTLLVNCRSMRAPGKTEPSLTDSWCDEKVENDTRLPFERRGTPPVSTTAAVTAIAFLQSDDETESEPSKRNTTSRMQSHSAHGVVVDVVDVNVVDEDEIVDVVLLKDDTVDDVVVVVDPVVEVRVVSVIVVVERVAVLVGVVVGVVLQPSRHGSVPPDTNASTTLLTSSSRAAQSG